jgi:Flp pilus assembly protein TadG
MRRRLRDDRGAALAFVVVFMVVLLGVSALVVDWGSWFTEQRHLQAAADAATMAAAQDLPNTATASTDATAYAATNVSGLDPWTPSFPNSSTIDVTLTKQAPGFFSKFLGINSMNVHAHARAIVGAPKNLKFVAPVAVKSTSACLATSTGCFGATRQLNLSENNLSASKFGLITLNCEGATASSCSSSSTGASDLESWIRNGFSDYLDVNKWFAAVPGEKIGPLRDALADAGTQGRTLLFPVFDTVSTSPGAFHVIGWAAYVIDPTGVLSWKNDVPGCTPNCKLVSGHFTTYIAHGVDIDPAGTNFGVRVIGLTQ